METKWLLDGHGRAINVQNIELRYIDDCGLYHRVFSWFQHCGVVIKHFRRYDWWLYRGTTMAINGSLYRRWWLSRSRARSLSGIQVSNKHSVNSSLPCRYLILWGTSVTERPCSASDHWNSNFESCVWRAVSSHSSHHPQNVFLAKFSI